MTEEKKFLPTRHYFNVGAIEVLYKLFFRRFQESGEPVPDFSHVFLGINGYELAVDPDIMTRKALEVAQSDPFDFKRVKKDLSLWIRQNLQEGEPA